MSPAKPPKSFDVWFVAANTVYKAVPYNVVADWTGQGRLSSSDRLRPAGTEGWDEARLAAIVREGDMIGVTIPKLP